MSRKGAVLVAAAITLALVATPSLAGAPSKSKGTWTFTDTTPDPTVVLNDAHLHCHGVVPAAPVDVNAQPFKAKKPGTLKLTAHNALDWAVEVRDSHGNVIAGTDSEDSFAAENLTATLPRAGTYSVVYCNFSGEPQITVDYAFKAKR